jgi:starch synthase (maltosyl-transferring)
MQRRPERLVIENVRPQVDCGRFPIKRCVGESVEVSADVFAEGHDQLRVLLLHRRRSESRWRETPMRSLGNDAWTGAFRIEALEPYHYCVEAWADAFATWSRDLARRVEAGQDPAVELLAGARLVAAAAGRARGEDAKELAAAARGLGGRGSVETRVSLALSEDLGRLMARRPDRRDAARLGRELLVDVDRERARYGSWYEMFPRSCAPQAGRHGTLRDCENRLAYVAGMGFDVLYLPPLHPIGESHRKGPNNDPVCSEGDVGSPWAIGSAAGGHTALHPDLGSPADFRRLLARAKQLGIEVALDIAFQCSPDHPWVREHPQWFKKRPDGSVQYAENPPKKYEDIFPLNFECEDWKSLWDELRRVVLFWARQGVRIFRVDNPHTKPFRFWEWLIRETRKAHPELIFLSEAFTRPKVMYQLAKLGFSQSYTYFAWRRTKAELTEYFEELSSGPPRDFFRSNLWPNTPDILTEELQFGGRAVFQSRLVLAATLGASYGIYGPAFELMEARPRSAGSEEYLDSEKYQLRHWDLERADSLRELVGRVNRIRRENPALQSDRGLRFHEVDNEKLIAYSKATPDQSNLVLTLVNLDPHHVHSGWLELPLAELGLEPDRPYQVHDLLSDARYLWSGPRNYVELDPAALPAHIFRLRKRVRSERDFDYFL